MPFIQTRTNCKIDKEKELRIKKRLGAAVIEIGKNENWLMLEFVPECNMYFAGSDEKPMAYVDIKLYGACNTSHYENMTVAVTQIINEELGIDPNLIYISYGEFSNWGWGGHNF
jgi:phenylpyruvate tautomerase PptA (4-oxalocrotonate tautomerase family)